MNEGETELGDGKSKYYCKREKRWRTYDELKVTERRLKEENVRLRKRLSIQGLTFQFEVVPDDKDVPYRLRIFGDLPFGNREILFDRHGIANGGGTLLAGICKPTWAAASNGAPATPNEDA